MVMEIDCALHQFRVRVDPVMDANGLNRDELNGQPAMNRSGIAKKRTDRESNRARYATDSDRLRASRST